MSRRTQGILLAFLGAVLIRLALGEAYLRYVTEWMKWPILVSGVLLVLLAIGPVLDLGADDDESGDGHGSGDEHDEHAGHAHGEKNGGVPYVTWLLVLPGLVAFMIAPPALGSYLAERRADEVVTTAPATVAPIADGDVVPLELQEFIYRAQDGGSSIAGRTVDLTGFVSYDAQGHWFVTRMSISCCAADAVAYRVQVDADRKPPRDQWVTVTGTYVDGSGVLNADGTGLESTAAVDAVQVVETTEPDQTYS